MKTTSIIFYVVVALSLLISCTTETIRVTGEVTRKTIDISGYSGLKVSDAFNVFVTFSQGEEEIIVEANSDIQEEIIVKREDRDLVIKLKNFTTIKGNATLNVYVTTPDLERFTISGASDVVLENDLIVDKVVVKLSGASSFSGELAVDQLDLESHGASSVDIIGTATNVKASLSGSSELRDYGLVSSELDANLSGASDAFLSVTEAIRITASGSSSLTYTGNAIIEEKQLTGSSKIIKKN